MNRRSIPFRSLLLTCASASAIFAGAAASAQTPSAGPSHGIEAYVSEDALQGLYARRMEIGELGNSDVHVGVFLNEDRDLVGIGDLLIEVADPARFPRWSFQVGPRTYGALLSVENEDIFGIGLGGRARYTFGGSGSVSIHLTGFYAPDILTFGEADDVSDVSARLELAMNSGLTGFIGYRIFEIGLIAQDKRLDDGLHIGVRREFR